MLERGDDLFHGPGQSRQLQPSRHGAQRVGERRPCPDLQHHATQLHGELPGSHTGHALHGIEEPLPRREAERQELQRRRKLLGQTHLPRTHPRRQSHVVPHTGRRSREERDRPDRKRPPTHHDENDDGERPGDDSAHDHRELTTAEGDGIECRPRLREPPSESIRPAEQTVERPRPARTEAEPSGGQGAWSGEGIARQHLVVDDVPHVRRDPRRERRRPPPREARQKREDTRGESPAEQHGHGERREPAHPNHRRGSGSRPIRIMRRNATTDTTAPTTITAIPSGVP